MTKRLLEELKWLMSRPYPDEFQERERELTITARDGRAILKAVNKETD